MSEYIVVRASIEGGDIDEFIKEVNSLMQEGWEPYGSIAAEHALGYSILYQPMIKEGRDE